MTIEQLIKLVDAGFTREEIAALVNSTVEPENTHTEQEQTTNNEQKPVQNPDQSVTDNNQLLIETINKLTQTIQASNIGRSQMGNPQPPLTADEVLASIIAPNSK